MLECLMESGSRTTRSQDQDANHSLKVKQKA